MHVIYWLTHPVSHFVSQSVRRTLRVCTCWLQRLAWRCWYSWASWLGCSSPLPLASSATTTTVGQLLDIHPSQPPFLPPSPEFDFYDVFITLSTVWKNNFQSMLASGRIPLFEHLMKNMAGGFLKRGLGLGDIWTTLCSSSSSFSFIISPPPSFFYSSPPPSSFSPSSFKSIPPSLPLPLLPHCCSLHVSVHACSVFVPVCCSEHPLAGGLWREAAAWGLLLLQQAQRVGQRGRPGTGGTEGVSPEDGALLWEDSPRHCSPAHRWGILWTYLEVKKYDSMKKIFLFYHRH